MDAQHAAGRKQGFACMLESDCSVMRKLLSQEDVAIEASHLFDRKDPDRSE